MELLLVSPGPRPPYWTVAEHLWGEGCDFDSDGDSSPPDSQSWTELTVILRSDTTQRVDIDPLSKEPLVLVIRSEQAELASKAAEYLSATTGGVIASKNSN